MTIRRGEKCAYRSQSNGKPAAIVTCSNSEEGKTTRGPRATSTDSHDLFTKSVRISLIMDTDDLDN